MTYLTKWRKKYGISQESLAFYLETSRSLLGMAEIKKRVLPTKSLLRFTELESILQNGKQSSEAQNLQGIKEYWQKYETDLSFRMLKLERELVKAQKEKEVLENRQEFKHILENHLQDLPQSEEKERMQIWFDSLGIHQEESKLLAQTFALQKIELALESLTFDLEKVKEKLA